jgi:hypothetical protein
MDEWKFFKRDLQHLNNKLKRLRNRQKRKQKFLRLRATLGNRLSQTGKAEIRN